MTATVQRLAKAIDSERHLIGCVVKFPERAGELLGLVNAIDFVDRQHQTIWRRLNEQYAAVGEVDVLIVARELGDNTAGYFYEIAEQVVTTAHATFEAGKIIEAGRKRQLLSIGESIVEGALNGKPARDVALLAAADLNDYQREASSGRALLDDLKPAREFVRQDHRVDYLIPFMIVARQPGIISARAKSLKTTIAIDALISMATATPFLGKWEVPNAVRCGILTAESGPATISETIQRIAASKGLSAEADDIDNLLVSTKCPRLQSPEWLNEIRRCIDDNGLRCLAIDPTYMAFAGLEQNNLSAVAVALAPVSEIIADTGCTILMVHHFRKVTPQPYGCPTLEEITGSGFAEWSRFWLLLNRRREWDDQAGQHWLWLATGGSAGFGARKWLKVREGKPTDLGGRVWDVEVLSATEGESQEQAEARRQKEERTTDQLASDKRKLVDVLRRCEGRQETKAVLRDRAGIRSQRFGSVLAELLDSGDVEPVQICKANNRKYDGFRLVERSE